MAKKSRQQSAPRALQGATLVESVTTAGVTVDIYERAHETDESASEAAVIPMVELLAEVHAVRRGALIKIPPGIEPAEQFTAAELESLVAMGVVREVRLEHVTAE